MSIFKRYIAGVVLFFVVVMLFSCNLEDFNLNKLTNKDDIIPDVYAPLAYGTFKVSDLVSVPAPSDNYQIPAGGLSLAPVILNKTGTSLTSSAIDSVYLITRCTNETPSNLEFQLSFVNALGNQIGIPFPVGKIPAGSVDQEILFPLGPIDQDNLQRATSIKLSFNIFSLDAANPILYKAVKKSLIMLKISFYAPINLRKL